ncbi:Hypothetical protein PBC10988_16540 [Planctomycetales bacterium 10988]|nr:Hypothetical protein PBC10988_16540 [Planctomycetales bacterium 10988]
MKWFACFLGLVGLSLLTAIGCGTSAIASNEDFSAYLLSEEPQNAVDLQELLAEETLPESVTVLGKIGETEQSVNLGQAVFVVKCSLEDSASAHAHHHHEDGHSCAFCKSREKNQKEMLLVQVIDKNGNVLNVDPQKSFGLEEGQTVILKGTPKRNSLGYLTLAANQLYIKK